MGDDELDFRSILISYYRPTHGSWPTIQRLSWVDIQGCPKS